MAKFKEGDVVYHTPADGDHKYFELRVVSMDDDGFFDGYVNAVRGYEGYEVGEYCPSVNGNYYKIKKDGLKDLLTALNKLETDYGKV